MAIPAAVSGAMTLGRAVSGRALSSIREVFRPAYAVSRGADGRFSFQRRWNYASLVTAAVVGNEAGKRIQDRAKVRKRDQVRI